MKSIDSKSISKFWNWFQTISDDLLKYKSRRDLINEIDTLVANQWGFDWEIGPYDDGKLFFCISPGLDIERLEITRQIIALAPPCNGWIFLSSKPVKAWKGIWDTTDHRGSNIRIDTNDWEYILYAFDDGTYEIDIFIPEASYNVEIMEQAVDIALTGYLGEENYMNLITYTNIVDEFGENVKSRATKLRFIKEHIESLKT